MSNFSQTPLIQKIFTTTVPLLLTCVLVALIGFSVSGYLYVLLSNLNYPYEIHHFEGGIMESVLRVLDGKSVYAKPSIEYIPFIYTPFFYYATALFTKLFGVELIAGRMVSVCSFAAVLIILYQWARREGLPFLMAYLPPLLMVASFYVTGRIYHSMRVDMLFLALLFAGLFVYANYHSIRAMILAGVLLALAYFTKQPAALIVIITMSFGLIAYPKKTMIAGMTIAVCGSLIAAFLEWQSEGWFSYFTLNTPASMESIFYKNIVFWRDNILQRLPLLLLATGVLLSGFYKTDWKKGLLYSGIVIGGICGSWAGRIYPGGSHNVLLPCYALLFLTGCMGLHALRKQNTVSYSFLVVVLIFQFATVYYNPLPLVPSANTRLYHQKIMEFIASREGEVLIPDTQFLQTKVGKKPYNYRNMGFDIFEPEFDLSEEVKASLQREMQEALKNRKFSAILLTRANALPEKDPYYKEYTTLDFGRIDETISIYPPKGFPYLPLYVFVPRDKNLTEE